MEVPAFERVSAQKAASVVGLRDLNLASTERSSPRGYHHGHLREALIDSGLTLLHEKKVEELSVADAARLAGVSSGAPYRHFSDRNDFLAHLAAEGFDRLRAAMEEGLATVPQGSVEAVIKIGCVYVAFGARNPELFHLMWGTHRIYGGSDVTHRSGKRCYMKFIETLVATMHAENMADENVEAFGAPLWAMVHGYAALLVARNEMLDPAIDEAARRVERATRAYFKGISAE